MTGYSLGIAFDAGRERQVNTRNIALLGAALLVLGAFAPLVSLPLVGSVTAMQDGRALGWIWLVLAALAAYYAVNDEDEGVGRVGKGALAIASLWLLYMVVKLSDARATAAKEMEGSMFKSVADAAMGAIHFQWGWAALFVGAGTLIYAGAFAEKKFLCPRCKERVFEGDDDCQACGSFLRWVGEKVFLRPRPVAGAVPQQPAGTPPSGAA